MITDIPDDKKIPTDNAEQTSWDTTEITAREFATLTDLTGHVFKALWGMTEGFATRRLRDQICGVAIAGIQNAVRRYGIYERAARGGSDHELFQEALARCQTATDDPPTREPAPNKRPDGSAPDGVESWTNPAQMRSIDPVHTAAKELTREQIFGRVFSAMTELIGEDNADVARLMAAVEVVGDIAGEMNGADRDGSSVRREFSRGHALAKINATLAAMRDDDVDRMDLFFGLIASKMGEAGYFSADTFNLANHVRGLQVEREFRKYFEGGKDAAIVAEACEDLRLVLHKIERGELPEAEAGDSETGVASGVETEEAGGVNVNQRPTVADFADSLEFTVNQRFQYEKPQDGETFHVVIDQNDDGNLLLVDVADHSFDRENLKTYSTKISVKELKALGLGHLRPYGTDYTVGGLLHRLTGVNVTD